ncbi:phytanoyl-CoA dioxygenase family protein [Paludibacterium purpuratum]|uniref:Ectoine hydroxylase-related dioxygenase (Phytanoyl-CoA dioxygenase family) n=1 Tax=Paludibacterium purpuratum TaxID=1144873 RepID=A0A4R7B1W2_9NEIS|nr:phytanoyl-CoA dioxygenase family protein [Paludibacterium purpuratum]TDR73937.1 ectoine hydroxylase-related dioxygenase (phytanoyl-CoA dioxygenase family) [Paludibacterium purpuratum]
MATLQHFSPTDDVVDMIGALDRDGGIVVEHFMAPEVLDRLRASLLPTLRDIPDCSGPFFGRATRRMSGLIERVPVCRELAIDPLLLRIIDAFLLPNCEAYQLNLTQAIRIGPGEKAQFLHRDGLMFRTRLPEGETMLNCMFAVDAFTADNGATCVVPGSHRWPDERLPQADEAVSAAMPAGSVLIYLGSVVHGGGANCSDSTRTGVVLSYCLGWLRQAENQYLAVPPALARTLPERLQRLLGYFVHTPNLGCVDGQDPIGWLTAGAGAVAPGRFDEFLGDIAVPE